jgi:hypothetical protein
MPIENDKKGSLPPTIRGAMEKHAPEKGFAPNTPRKPATQFPPLRGVAPKPTNEVPNLGMQGVKIPLTPRVPTGRSTAHLLNALTQAKPSPPKIPSPPPSTSELPVSTAAKPFKVSPPATRTNASTVTPNALTSRRHLVDSGLNKDTDTMVPPPPPTYQANFAARPVLQRTSPTPPPVPDTLNVTAVIEPPSVKKSLDEDHDHVNNVAQHGPENHNPYDFLVAPLNNLPIILIGAFGTKTTNGLSPLLTSGEIKVPDPNHPNIMKSMFASLPFEYVLAASQIAAELGGPNSFLTSRVTVWAQDTIPNAGKPPSIKLKTGKGGISGGFIPVDLSTTTDESANGLKALVQKEGLRPGADEKDITTIQMTKPLDQVLLGLTKDPPDFIMLSSDAEIREKGYIEFKMNCTDSDAINQAVYRIDLCQNTREGNDRKETVKPLKIKDAGTARPSWWPEEMDKKFGNFDTKKHEAFHVDYKKSIEKPYEPYEVYARIDAKGNSIPLTGDQDLFIIPRSEKYNFDELAYELVDTKADNGVKTLVDKLKDIHLAIYEQDVAAGRKIYDKNDRFSRKQYIHEFHKFTESAHTYMKSLGTVTPYEAYFIIMLNNQVAQIRDLYKDKPEELKQLLQRVPVELSMGLQHKKIQEADFDMLKPWMREKPAELIPIVDAQLAKDRYVSPDILMLQVEQKVLLRQVMEAPKPAMLEHIKNNLLDLVEENHQWKMWARVPGPPPPKLEGFPDPQGPFYQMIEVTEKNMGKINKNQIVDLVIRTKDEHGQNFIRVTDKGITSSLSGPKAGIHLNSFLDQAKVKTKQAFEELVVEAPTAAGMARG